MGRAVFPSGTGLELRAGWAEFQPLGGPNLLEPLGTPNDLECDWLSALRMVAQVSTGVGLKGGRLQASLWRGFGALLGARLWALLEARTLGLSRDRN